MPFLEWRKFTFFDLKRGVDDGKLADSLKDIEVTVSTSDNNQLVLGDSTGQIYQISRSWHETNFKAYDQKVYLAQQLRNLLVTIGEDEPGVNPIIKVWDLKRTEKSDTPFCCRVTRTVPNNRPVQASALCVHENLQLMAVGFADGSLLLYRGDITRDRGSRAKLLSDGGSSITGLAFKSMSVSILLFVATEESVFVYNLTHKDKEQKLKLDSNGCSKKCSVLTESVQESHFVIASNNAIYFYTSDGKGPCYAVEGDKVLLEWFRSYLVIISKTNRGLLSQINADGQNPNQQHMITVLDIQNKLTVFSDTINEVKAVFNEWGAFYILDCENNVYHLDEKDLQTKLSLLFKRNFYDFAIRIAKSEQYDSDGLVDIFQQYGDHLYWNGAHASAIDQYIKTIGKLEPSYVIKKFVDSQHIELLTKYLQAIHKQGHATEDHTTLLLNCFTKLNKNDSLKEFILMKDRDLDFNVDIAIKVCRQGNPEEALMLAKKHAKHDWYIKLQIEDHCKYSDVLDYISCLDFKEAEFYMRKYGSVLLQHTPHESTNFLKVLCTEYKPNTKDDFMDVTQKADPDDFIHLFLNNSKCLVKFLEHLIHVGCILSSSVYDTLLEHYLHVWVTLDVGPEKTKYAQKIIKLLQSSESKYDKPQALIVCHMHGFSEGVLYLYQEEKLYQQILRYYMACQDSNAVLSCCRKYGQQEPCLWVQAFFSCIRDSTNVSIDILPEILTIIAKEELLSPQFVMEAIGTGKRGITIGHISSYLLSELNKEQSIINNDKELTKIYRKDIEKLKEQLEMLKYGTLVIQASTCAACNHPLELPSVHFLCQHSYHQHCFQSYSENEIECPACQPENEKLIEKLKAREYNEDLHEEFHSELEKRSDGLSLAAEYFSRSVFNKLKLVTDPGFVKTFSMYDFKKDKTPQLETQIPMYGLGAEARIRQIENARSIPSIIPATEGRMRQLEKGQLHKNIAKHYGSRKAEQKKNKEASTNPFEMDANNPFDDYVYDDDKNPFKNDYDTNLNQF